MSTDEGAFAVMNKPTLLQRLWRRLGYGFRFDEALFDWRNQEPPEEGFVPGAMSTHVTIHVSWPDRLRLLLSGRCEIVSYMKTDTLVNRAATRSQFAVLPPSN